MPRTFNAELFRQIADAIESDPHAYCQATYGERTRTSECGTTCCIAGWAVKLTDEEDFNKMLGDAFTYSSLRMMPSKAAKALGLTQYTADLLFTTGFTHNADTAPAVLRKFADDGKVDLKLWRDSAPDEEEED